MKHWKQRQICSMIMILLLGVVPGTACAKKAETEVGTEEETTAATEKEKTEAGQTEEKKKEDSRSEQETTKATDTRADKETETDTEMETETEAEKVDGSEAGLESVIEGLIEEETEVTDEKLKQMLTEVNSSLPAGNGIWAVYICDLVNGSEGSIQEERMQAASLIKLYIMGAVYENYDKMISNYGEDTIYSNLYSMITVSDNDAANTLTGYLGDGDSSAGMMVVNDFCMEHGFTRSSMGRLLLQSNEFGDNYTSVTDCGHFLRAIYEKDPDYAHAEEMYDLLKAQTRRNKIPSQMPEGAHIANKTGELDNVENDAGIIYDSGNDFVVVFMSENLQDVGTAQYSIGAISRQIYDYYEQ